MLQIITMKGQSLDAASLLPGSTSVVDMKAHYAGDWIYQCDVQARTKIHAAAAAVGPHKSCDASVVLALFAQSACH